MPVATQRSPWLKHVDRWKNCKVCGLCDQRNRIVLGKGSIPCSVLFIGEAPGESENSLGLPFVGPAGQLLDHLIKVANQEMAHDFEDWNSSVSITCAFTNLVACFPANAKKTNSHEPSKGEIEACRPRLSEFIKLAKPMLIVCVGSLADKHAPSAIPEATIRGDGSVEDHATIKRWTSIVHPASILRMPLAQQDMAIRRAVVVLRQAMEETFLVSKKS